MKCLFLTALLALAPSACADAESPNSAHLDSGARADADTTLVDASTVQDHGDAQSDGAALSPDPIDGDVAADLDAEVSPYADLRTCSGNPLDTFVWPCAADAATCPEATRISQMCPLPWGCDEYALAVIAAVGECEPGRQVITAQGCGRTVIELRVGPGSPTRAFYSVGGGLMGTWSKTDVATDPEACSAFVPKDCLDWEGDSLSNVVNLCAAIDASADAADAADAH